MRTGTEFISEISAATIFTSFNFRIFQFSSFRFSGKGEVDLYRMYVYHMTRTAPRAISLENHKRKGPV